MEQHVAEAAISSLMNATISSLLPGSSTFGQELELEEPPMGSTCEIGAIPMPSAEWLFTSVATFQQVYGQIHPYIAAVLCVVGTLMNIITVVVLTRPTMISSVNVLLCAVALCDIVVMSSYFLFVTHFLLAAGSRCSASDYSYGWAIFMMFHAHVSVIFHAASIWMTVSLAQIRVLTIRRATSHPGQTLISERFTAVLAIVTCFLMAIVNVPNFLTFEIMEVPSSMMLSSCLQPTPTAELPDALLSAEKSTLVDGPKGLSLESEKMADEQLFQFPKSAELSAQTFSNAPTPKFSSLQTDGNVLSAHIGDKSETIKASDSANSIAKSKRGGKRRGSKRSSKITQKNKARPKRNKKPVEENDGAFEASEILRQIGGSEAEEEVVYTVRAHDGDCMKLKLAFWSNGTIFKVVPCLMLTLSVFSLLKIIAEVGQKRKNLAKITRKKYGKDHTTPMLAAVLSIFLIAELPQGIMLVLTGIFSSDTFHKKIYLPLGDFMDLLSLLNSAIGFLIYILMSRKFRTVFLQLVYGSICFVFNGPMCVDERNNKERQQHLPSTAANGHGEVSAAFFSHCHQSGDNGGRGQRNGGACGTAETFLLQRQDASNRPQNDTDNSLLQKECKNNVPPTKGWRQWFRLPAALRISRYEHKCLEDFSAMTTRTERLPSSSIIGAPSMLIASCAAAMTAAATSVGPQLLGLGPDDDISKRLSICSYTAARQSRASSRGSGNFLLVPSPQYGIQLQSTSVNGFSTYGSLSHRPGNDSATPMIENIAQQSDNGSLEIGQKSALAIEADDTLMTPAPELGQNQQQKGGKKRISFNVPISDEEVGIGVQPKNGKTSLPSSKMDKSITSVSFFSNLLRTLKFLPRNED